MKRLSLLTLTITLILGCQRSQAQAIDAMQPRATNNGNPGLTRLTSCYEADEWTCAVEKAIIEKTNEKRGDATSLKQSFETSFVARLHSGYMESKNEVNHDGFQEGKREDVLEKEFPGLSLRFTAENVASMSLNSSDADRVAQKFVDMWWNSPGHKRNMLGNHKFIGVGVFRSEENGIFATQIFH